MLAQEFFFYGWRLKQPISGILWGMQRQSFSRIFRQEWPWISYLVVFAVSFAVLLYLQASPTFADPDSFYHAKMALLIRDHGGPIVDFPWLRLTTLGQHYTDQHFLYHVLLIPFETWFSPLVGLKLATVFFGSTLVTTLYWFMRQFQVRGAFLFAMLLLTIRPFTFRISLAKAPSTSLIFLFIGLAWIFRYHFKRLFGLAFAYVWYYGGFPLLGFAAVAYAAISSFINRVRGEVRGHHLVRKIISLASRRPFSIRRHPNRDVVLVTLGGLTAGVIFNPYFPANIHFYYQQLVNIGIINFQKVIGVGSEWYPYGFTDLVANGAIASLLILLALIGILWRFKAQTKQTWTLLFLTAFFFVLTLKSRRYVEYYIPTAVLFGAMSLSDTMKSDGGRMLLREGGNMLKKSWAKWLAGLLAIYLLFGFGFVIGRDFRNEQQELHSGFRLNQWQPASYWLLLNTPLGSRVVHSDWDEFPVLFYFNSHNTYVAGLDPTFLYKADPDTYWTWVNITLGKYSGDVYDAVTKKLGAQYVFIANGHQLMDNLFANNNHFKLRYQDTEAKIYEAIPTSE